MLTLQDSSPEHEKQEPFKLFTKSSNEKRYRKTSSNEQVKTVNTLKLKIQRAQSDFLSQRTRSKMMEQIMPNFSQLQFRPENKMQVGKEKLLRMTFISRSKSDDPTDLLFRTVSKASSAFHFQPPQLLIDSNETKRKKIEPQPENRSQRCKQGLEYLFRYVSSFMVLERGQKREQKPKKKDFDFNGSLIISQIDSDDQFSIIQEIQSKQTQPMFSNNYFSHLNAMLEEEIEDASRQFPPYSITINGEESKEQDFEEIRGRIKSNSVYAGSRNTLQEEEELKDVEYGLGLVRNKSQSIRHTDWRKWYE